MLPSHRNVVARVLAALILVSAISAIPLFWSIATNWDYYSSWAGILTVLSTLPVWIGIVGAFLILIDKRYGFWVLLVGTILSFVGSVFSYIPFVPWFDWSPTAGFFAVYITNLVVVGLIGYCLFAKNKSKHH